MKKEILLQEIKTNHILSINEHISWFIRKN